MMSHNAAIDMLTNEHKVILQVVEGLSLLAAAMRSGKTVDPALLLEAVAFMREFADQCHHAKEEDLLFPALIDHGVPLHGCPIDALLLEHEQGRKLVREIADGTDAYIRNEPGAADAIARAIDKITTLYPNHIWKEDEMVFPMVQRLIPEGDRITLYAAFQEVEARNPPGTHERFHAFARQLGAVARP
ncbi:MAG: hemerythrin domain-containing protein [Sphingomonadales bacterium]